jgi:GlpG protein
MRKICEFDEEKKALRFWNFLKENKIDSSLENDDEAWILWVEEEESVTFASSAFEEFLLNPDDPKFLSSTPDRKPPDSREVEDPLYHKSRYQVHRLRDRWSTQNGRLGTVTFSLILTCLCVYLPSALAFLFNSLNLPTDFWMSIHLTLKHGLQIAGSELDPTGNPMTEEAWINKNNWSDLLSGQFWRVITPVFLHFSFFHILFNMFWLFSLGKQIENRKGGKFFLTFVLILAATSNLAEFTLPELRGNFGGMSGVVYGLFGYVFVKSKLDPGDGFGIDRVNEVLMIGWFFLCWMGVFDHVRPDGTIVKIANWAHTGGLVVGLVWGYVSALRWNRGGN